MAIRFLHAADLHLDSSFKGLTELSEEMKKKLQSSTFQAFDQLIEHAIMTQPDFLVLAGDIYDGEERSLRAQSHFQQGMEKLQAHNISVFCIHGNHDHLQGNWARFQLPSNVHTFSSQVTCKTIKVRNQRVDVIGFSYQERHIHESMIEQYPLADSNADYTIGLLHGSEATNTTHDVYAPFTKEQLIDKKYSYWALGHIHQRQALATNPPIYYSGNLQGLNRKEQGDKGFYDIQLAKTEVEVTFVSTAAIRFESCVINCSQIVHANEWLGYAKEQLLAFANDKGPLLVEVILTDLSEEGQALFKQASTKEWLWHLRAALEGQKPLIWVQTLYFQYSSELEEHSIFATTVAQQIESWTFEDWRKLGNELYQHPEGMHYLDKLRPEEVEELLVAAKQQLQEQLIERK